MHLETKTLFHHLNKLNQLCVLQLIAILSLLMVSCKQLDHIPTNIWDKHSVCVGQSGTRLQCWDVFKCNIFERNLLNFLANLLNRCQQHLYISYLTILVIFNKLWHMHTDDVTSQNNCSCAKCKNNFRKTNFSLYTTFSFSVLQFLSFSQKFAKLLTFW